MTIKRVYTSKSPGEYPDADQGETGFLAVRLLQASLARDMLEAQQRNAEIEGIRRAQQIYANYPPSDYPEGPPRSVTEPQLPTAPKAGRAGYLEREYGQPRQWEQSYSMDQGVTGGIQQAGAMGMLPAVASVRRFAAGIDPTIKVDQGYVTARGRLRDFIVQYMVKNDMISKSTLDDPKKFGYLLGALTDTLGPSGLRVLHNIRRIATKGKLDSPVFEFTTDPTSTDSSFYPFEQLGSASGKPINRIELGGQAAAATNAPNLYWEALPEELAHGVHRKLSRFNIKANQTKLAQTETLDWLANNNEKAPIKEILRQYLSDPRNTAWKQYYAGPGKPESNVVEYIEQFIRPFIMPASTRMHHITGPQQYPPPPSAAYKAGMTDPSMGVISSEKPLRWRLWEQYPQIARAVSEALDLSIPKAMRKKYRLGEFAVTPEELQRVKILQAQLEADAKLYKGQVLQGPPVKPAKKVAQP